MSLPKLVALAGLAASANAASQLVTQGGVRIDGQKVTSVKERFDASRAPFVLEVGRRAVRVVLVP